MRWPVLFLTGALVLSGACKKNQKEEVDPLLPGKDTQKPLEQPKHVVVFMFDYSGVLVPLACWNDQKKAVEAQGSCISLIAAEGEKAKLGSGKVVTMGSEQQVVCEPTGDEAYGLTTDTTPGDSAQTDYGVWPADGRGRWQHVKLSGSATPEVRQALMGKVVAEAEKLKGRPMKLMQSTRADLDGDGKADTIYSVVVDYIDSDEPEGPGYAFSGLLVTWGGNGQTQVLDKSGWDQFQVIATTDLDGDKKRELLLYTHYYEGEAMQMVRWNGSKLETIGGWGCGA